MREFVQRAIRTFGSPFKTKRERNPHRSAEETLESQTGPLQMGQKDEARSTSASLDDAASIAKPISILSREESITSQNIPPSRASTTYATDLMSGDSRQFPQREHHGEDRPQFTEGPCRIVMTSDGTKDCMALLLTQRLTTEFNGIIEEIRYLEIANKELDEVRSKANVAEQTAKELNAELEKAEDPDLINDISKKIEAQNQIFIANIDQRESLTQSIVARNQNLKYRHIAFQRIFGGALQDANLMNPPEVKIEGLNPPQAARDRQDSITVSENDESPVSLEELFRRNAYDDLEFARENLADAQTAFDSRHVKYKRALYEFLIDLNEGTTSCTQSTFDRLALERMQDLTRALIDAEADYEPAVKRAKALGVLMNELDQESNFASDMSDGYRISAETSMRAAVDSTFIQSWNDDIVSSGPEELEELEEPEDPEDWDAQTVGISDSVSVVDRSRNRRRIDRWREMCGQ